MDADRCVSCGEIIPEGRQVCILCEHRANKSRDAWSEISDILKKYKIPYTTHFEAMNKHIQINLTIPNYCEEGR